MEVSRTARHHGDRQMSGCNFLQQARGSASSGPGWKESARPSLGGIEPIDYDASRTIFANPGAAGASGGNRGLRSGARTSQCAAVRCPRSIDEGSRRGARNPSWRAGKSPGTAQERRRRRLPKAGATPKSAPPARTPSGAAKSSVPVKAPAKAQAKAPAKAPVKAPAKAPATAASEKPAAKPPVEKPEEQKASAARRDPFETLLNTAKAGNAPPENLPPGKAGLVIGTLRIEGIIRGRAA